MFRALVVVAIAAGCLTACVLDRQRFDRPARLLVGTNARDLAGSEDAVALRSSTPSSEVAPVAHSARTMSAQFTMRLPFRTFAGGEVEAGVLDTRRSNFAGAYGVLGAEHAWRSASLGVELVGGWRGLRDGSGKGDVNTLIAEPRLRAQLRLAEQWTLGGVTGATFGERGSWMAGIYLGVHSHGVGR